MFILKRRRVFLKLLLCFCLLRKNSNLNQGLIHSDIFDIFFGGDDKNNDLSFFLCPFVGVTLSLVLI